MAKNEGKGSILLKILILFLIIIVYLTITIPKGIWSEEKQELYAAYDNMSGLYEAQKLFFRLTQTYTADLDLMLSTIKSDSTLYKKEAVVKHTTQLKNNLDRYRKNTYSKNLLSLGKNIHNIIGDFDNKNNRRNMKIVEELLNRGDQLKLRLLELVHHSQHAVFFSTVAYLDSVSQLRRDLSDYTLQVGAQRAVYLTDSLRSLLQTVNLEKLETDWKSLAADIIPFTKEVRFSDIAKQSSVGDRILDFATNVNETFAVLKDVKISAEIDNANKINGNLNQLYEKFLNDFVITSKYAEYNLSYSDSLLLNLSKSNFNSPINGEPYKILISPDSLSVRVESPVLLSELKGKVAPISERLSSTGIDSVFDAYSLYLKTIVEKSADIRKKIRKNTDVFMKYKEIEGIVQQYDEISVYSANKSLKTLMQTAEKCQSYGNLTTHIEEALNGVRIFEQAYTDNFFGNLDSLHQDVVKEMVEFNKLLASVRRLPRGVENFDSDIELLSANLQNIKNLSSAGLTQTLQTAASELGTALTFANEGSGEAVYGVFEKQIINPGYIANGGKSWEEKK
jgi:ABC-type phosphate transport system auxiliary subunit